MRARKSPKEYNAYTVVDYTRIVQSAQADLRIEADSAILGASVWPDHPNP
jgi:hypothetical protein